MRPIDRPAVGAQVVCDGVTHSISSTYKPYSNAKPLLEAHLGYYCHYCEVFSSDLEVEHIVSQHENNALAFDWSNFLLACGRCNGRDNKGSQPVEALLKAGDIYLPHLNNTLLVFEYKELGFVGVNPALNATQRTKAENLLNLVKVDKYPGNAKYPPTKKHPLGFPSSDNRWRLRAETWRTAQQKLAEYPAAFSPDKLAEFAKERGFFSIWFTVFASHPEVQKALVKAFSGTAHCFDGASRPLPRNPTNATDPI